MTVKPTGWGGGLCLIPDRLGRILLNSTGRNRGNQPKIKSHGLIASGLIPGRGVSSPTPCGIMILTRL